MEALGAVPGHVLDHHEGAVEEQDIVEIAMGDDCLLCPTQLLVCAGTFKSIYRR